MKKLDTSTPILNALIIAYYPTYEDFAKAMDMPVGDLLDKLTDEQDWFLPEMEKAIQLLKIPISNAGRVFFDAPMPVFNDYYHEHYRD